jgi:hypothetical protein
MLAIAANVTALPSLQRGNPAPYEAHHHTRRAHCKPDCGARAPPDLASGQEAMRRRGTVRSAYASATGRRWLALQ